MGWDELELVELSEEPDMSIPDMEECDMVQGKQTL
jgi:hypothetical protein